MRGSMMWRTPWNGSGIAESRSRSAAQAVGLLLLVLSPIPLFSGGSCTIAYSSCSDNCDPCVTTCKCPHQHCNQSTGVDFEAARKLESYELAIAVEPDGRTTKIYARIVGLSIERALGRAVRGAADLRGFAEGVIAVNPESFDLASSGDRWNFEATDVYDTASVVTFRGHGSKRAEDRTLTFLFDARGNLIEIDDAVGAP